METASKSWIQIVWVGGEVRCMSDDVLATSQSDVAEPPPHSTLQLTFTSVYILRFGSSPLPPLPPAPDPFPPTPAAAAADDPPAAPLMLPYPPEPTLPAPLMLAPMPPCWCWCWWCW